MTETLEYRARQYAAELGNERLAELILDLVDEIDTLHTRTRDLEEEGIVTRERVHDLKRQLNGALSAYSAAASEADHANAAALSLQQEMKDRLSNMSDVAMGGVEAEARLERERNEALAALEYEQSESQKLADECGRLGLECHALRDAWQARKRQLDAISALADEIAELGVAFAVGNQSWRANVHSEIAAKLRGILGNLANYPTT